MKNFDQAQDAYVKAIRISNLKKEQLQDGLLYQRLGDILLKKKLW